MRAYIPRHFLLNKGSGRMSPLLVLGSPSVPAWACSLGVLERLSLVRLGVTLC